MKYYLKQIRMTHCIIGTVQRAFSHDIERGTNMFEFVSFA
jgi:hypothetical protein